MSVIKYVNRSWKDKQREKGNRLLSKGTAYCCKENCSWKRRLNEAALRKEKAKINNKSEFRDFDTFCPQGSRQKSFDHKATYYVMWPCMSRFLVISKFNNLC